MNTGCTRDVWPASQGREIGAHPGFGRAVGIDASLVQAEEIRRPAGWGRNKGSGESTTIVPGPRSIPVRHGDVVSIVQQPGGGSSIDWAMRWNMKTKWGQCLQRG